MNTYLDLETFSKTDLKKSGAYRYAKNCEILMCATKESDAAPRVLFSGFPTNTTLSVYNAGFESPVLNDASLNFRDVQHKVAAHGLPLSLDKAGQALGLSEDKAKGKQGKRLIAKFCKPDKSGVQHSQVTAPEDWDLFVNYCKMDVVATQAIDELLPDLTKSEQELAELDLKINSAGIPIDVSLVKRINDLIQEYTADQIQQCKDITGYSPSQRVKIMDWCEQNDYPLSGYTAETIKSALLDLTIPIKVKQVLQIRQNTSLSSLKKYQKMIDSVCKDGRIRGTMQFHAASTGRWGGRGIQPQNLPRGTIDANSAIEAIKAGADIAKLAQLFDSPTEVFKSCIRGMIYHPQGLTVVDYAGIEARVVQWLADDDKSLQIFRDGKDVYRHMAAQIFNAPYDQVTKDQRFLGKQAILGLSYQMGKDRFIETCAGYGVEVAEVMAQKTVHMYRNTHQKLVNFWKIINQAALLALKTKKPTKAGLIGFELNGDFLYMQLPSGRSIAYPFPKLGWSSWGSIEFTYLTSNGTRTSTYGGKLVENATQGVARDILADALKKLDAKDYKIVCHIHDEVIIEGTYPPEEIGAIMCNLEPWADGNIIDAEGFNCQRYKKG